jgi:hypothetical protein
VIHVCLYKKRRDGNSIDELLDLFSGGGGYYHAELLFSDGLSFTSTTMDFTSNGPDGTRFKRIDYHEHPERWDLIPVPTTAVEEEVVRAFCRAQIGCRYDKAGCVRFVIPFWKEHPDKWFCSEVVCAALQQLFARGVETDATRVIRRLRGVKAHKVAPNSLAKLLRTDDA